MEGQTKRKGVFVGGIDNSVTEEILYAAFIPFGDIKEISIPRDYVANKTKGIAFVDFDDANDAQAAVDNMDGAELVGRVLTCKYAKAVNNNKYTEGKAVWTSEEYIGNALSAVDDAIEIGTIGANETAE